MNELALFAGIGGGILGGLLCGFKTVCAVEINKFRRERLLQRQLDGCLPRFPIWDDIKTFNGNPWRGKIDIITGGFPCQDISCAGTRKGLAGSRSRLVFEMLRIIREVQPTYVLAENSPQLRTNGLGTIIEELNRMGYVGRVGVLGARHVGANHARKRMWIVAVAESQQKGPRGQPRKHRCVESAGDNAAHAHGLRGLQSQGRIIEIGQWFGHRAEQTSDAQGIGRQRLSSREAPSHAESGYNTEHADRVGITDWWRVPRFAGVDDGMADRVERIKATGDGQVPQVARIAWEILSQ